MRGYTLIDGKCVVEEKVNNETFAILLAFMIIEAIVIGILLIVVARKWYLKTE